MNRKQYFSTELVDHIVNDIEEIPSSCFVDKSSTIHARSGGLSGSYKSCINKSIPKPLLNKLMSNAPDIGDYWLEEVIINKYSIGDSIPPHKDKHHYRKFILISLSESQDGLIVEDIFYEDKKGFGIEFTGTDDLHEVKPVKHKRYSLLYLYL